MHVACREGDVVWKSLACFLSTAPMGKPGKKSDRPSVSYSTFGIAERTCKTRRHVSPARRGCTVLYSDGARKGRGQLRYCTFSAPMGTRESHPACFPKRGANVNAQARGRVDPTASGVLSGPRRSSPHASRARRGRVGAQHHAIAQDKDELTSLRMALL